MPGYYSGLLEGMMAARQMEAQSAMTAERQQTVQLRQRQAEQEDAEKSILAQTLRGETSFQNGLDDAEHFGALAQQLTLAGRRLMSVNPARGLEMMKEAGTMRHQQALQGVRNIQMAQSKNEIMGTAAIGVVDQTSLNDAVQELAAAGIPVPPRYRQWGPEAQKWWGSRAATAKRNIDLLRVNAAETRAMTAAQAEQRKEGEARVKSQNIDVDNEHARYGQYLQKEREVRKSMEKAQYEGDAELAKSYRDQLLLMREEELQYQRTHGLRQGGGEAPAPDATPAQAPAQEAPEPAIIYLRAHPELKEAFKQKYGYIPEDL